jgi:hypothetical protein
LAGNILVSYLGHDNDQVSSYDVGVRTAAPNGALGAVVLPSAWQQTTATHESLTTKPGDTYCFVARSRDEAGNVSAWSAPRCTAVPMDDRGLKASAGWSAASGSKFYDRTITTTSKKGRTLTAKVRAKTLSVVASTCTTCGKVGVYWDGKLLKSVSLAGKTANRVVVAITDFPTDRAGTVTLKTLKKGHKVAIDGLVVSAV